MRHFLFILPQLHNDGRKNYEASHKAFALFASAECGGLTKHATAQGLWIGENQRQFNENVTCYTLAISGDAGEVDLAFARILRKAWELFPDQEALFSADLGTATVHQRPEAA